VLAFVAGIGMIAQVIGGVDGENALVATNFQHPFQQAAALVVQEVFVPRAFDQFGDDHDDAAVRMLLG